AALPSPGSRSPLPRLLRLAALLRLRRLRGLVLLRRGLLRQRGRGAVELRLVGGRLVLLRELLRLLRQLLALLCRLLLLLREPLRVGRRLLALRRGLVLAVQRVLLRLELRGALGERGELLLLAQALQQLRGALEVLHHLLVLLAPLRQPPLHLGGVRL